jgi:hypothetical protein
MTAVELCARCAGDPRDGIGYHAFDCAEVAPKERVMTASERLEEARPRVWNEIPCFVPKTVLYERVDQGKPERIQLPQRLRDEICAAATSPLLARIEVQGEAIAAELARLEHLCVVDLNTQLKDEERAYVAMCIANIRTALSSPSSIKEDVK